MKSFLILMCMGFVLTTPMLAQDTKQYDDRAKISVRGSAGIDVNPDQIVITFGIETDDLKIDIAKQKNNAIHEKALAVFKQLKIEPKNIQTDHLSIEPRWRDYRKEFMGYFVSHTIVVTITDVAMLEELITDVLQTGVNFIHNVDFQVKYYKSFREDARVMALKAAREKAVKMAEVLDQKVGRAIQINEGHAGYGYGSGGRSRSHMMIQNAISNQSNASEIAGSIAWVKVRISADVSVVFELLRSHTRRH